MITNWKSVSKGLEIILSNVKFTKFKHHKLNIKNHLKTIEYKNNKKLE